MLGPELRRAISSTFTTVKDGKLSARFGTGTSAARCAVRAGILLCTLFALGQISTSSAQQQAPLLGEPVHPPQVAHSPDPSALSKGGQLKQIPLKLKPTDDPAVTGIRKDFTVQSSRRTAGKPGSEQDIEESLKQIHFLQPSLVHLSSGASHSVKFILSQPGLLLARASWLGSDGPVTLTANEGGSSLGEGRPITLPSQQGVAILRVETSKPGTIVVSVHNLGKSPTNLRLFIATADSPAQEKKQ